MSYEKLEVEDYEDEDIDGICELCDKELEDKSSCLCAPCANILREALNSPVVRIIEDPKDNIKFTEKDFSEHLK